MLNLLLALLTLPAFANEVPAHTAEYHCEGDGSSAVVFDAFDDNWQRLYTSANVQGVVEFAGFVTSASRNEGELFFVTWTGTDFQLVGKFTPSLPSRNFSAVLYPKGSVPVQMGCTF